MGDIQFCLGKIKLFVATNDKSPEILVEAVKHFEKAICFDKNTPGYDSMFNNIADMLSIKIEETDGSMLVKEMFDNLDPIKYSQIEVLTLKTITYEKLFKKVDKRFTDVEEEIVAFIHKIYKLDNQNKF